MGFGHRPNSHGEGRPSAKYLWSSTVSVKSSEVSVSRPSLQRPWPLGRSAKFPKVLTSRSLGQISMGLGPSVARPSSPKVLLWGLSVRLTGHRAARRASALSRTGTVLLIIRYIGRKTILTIVMFKELVNCFIEELSIIKLNDDGYLKKRILWNLS